MIELKPIKESTSDFDRIESRMKSVFKVFFYLPLLKELGLSRSAIKNAKEDLVRALETGRITYSKGAFHGQFDATTTRELKKLGAVWDKGKFRLTKVPDQIRSALSIADVRFQERVARIDRRLKQIDPATIAEKIKTSDLFESTLRKTDKEIKKSAKDLTVYPELSPKERAKIADEWQNNMKKWINDFTENEIVRLRADIQKSVFSGNRHEAITDTLQRSYGVTASKAKFLARQETGLMMAKFKEARYTNIGIKEYKWRTVVGSKNHPVRPAHKILDGKIFKWDAPPITSEPDQPIRRNNPGEDFNCRCTAVPIVRFKTQ